MTNQHIQNFLNTRKKAIDDLLKEEKSNEVVVNLMIKTISMEIATTSQFFKGEDGFNFLTNEMVMFAEA